MLSERHDADSIAQWLRMWIRDGAASPKEAVCDMSLALLSAIAKPFGQMNSMTTYINHCYNILFNYQNQIPKIFIRCDEAHFVKNLVNLKCLKSQRNRTRHIYVRSLSKKMVELLIVKLKKNG